MSARRARFALALLLAICPSAIAQDSLPGVFYKKVPDSIQDLRDIESHVQDLIERVRPATVCLRIGNSQGSGVIINRQGYILTAGHVSGEPNREATVILADGRRLRGKTLGANHGVDSGMVVLTEKANVPYLDLARSADVHIGQWCLALGHPGGLKPGRPTVARLGRVQFADESAIVSDCVLVGGDSGGPLFDMYGDVIGINSRIGNKVTANVHVPVDTYHDTWSRLTKGESWGAPPKVLTFNKPAAAYMGVSASVQNKTLRVVLVTPGSPADHAGLKTDDVIVSIDNFYFLSSDDFADFMRSRRPGARLTLQVRRGAENLAISVVLGKR
ncbi:MAG TPA: S1C family serine protease [Gemmataceae bacterium]|nr:S1C family serine protease [Gemmataceae bacterium]